MKKEKENRKLKMDHGNENETKNGSEKGKGNS